MTRPKPDSPPPPQAPFIRASDLAHYGFCRRAWWLKTVKKWPAAPQAAQRRGQERHEQHARQLRRASGWRQTGLLLIIGGCLLLALALWLWLV